MRFHSNEMCFMYSWCIRLQPKKESFISLVDRFVTNIIYTNAWQTFSVKSQIVNIFSFGALIISVMVTQLCCNMKTALDNV